MDITPLFPEDRLRDPKRQAELAVYREIEASDAPGRAIYEAKANRNTPEIDFAVWLEEIGRFAMQVKGGIYQVKGGAWYLSTPHGEVLKKTPLAQLWKSTLRLHDYLRDQVEDNRNPFLVPVLNFPDMDPNPAIEEWAEHTHVHVAFGTDHLVERLIALAPHTKQLYPPTAEEIAEEVALVMPGQPEPTPAPDPMALQARQVVIHHVDQVIIYTMGGEAAV